MAWAPVAIVNLILLLYDFRKRRILTSAEEAVVLRELKSAGGLTSPELADALDFDTGTIETMLHNLGRKLRADGEPVVLVTRGPDGVWHCARV